MLVLHTVVEGFATTAMAQASSSKGSGKSVTMTSSRKLLLELLDRDSDVELVFTAAGKASQTVRGHSWTLKLWSGVLSAALDAAHKPARSGSSNTSQQITRIPMPGTSMEDWLLAMEFVYPVTPVPSFTWDNLPVLLELSSKYDMPALIGRAGQFIRAYSNELVTSPNSELFIWKWVRIADSYRLFDTAKACIKACCDLQGLVHSCPLQQLSGFSSQTTQQLVIMMSGAGFGQSYCADCRHVATSDRRLSCRITTKGRCTSCQNYF